MIDLRTTKTGNSWTRRCGDHEAQGFTIYLSRTSAHVTVTALGILFDVDRQDLPSAWATPIDVPTLRTELTTAIVSRMSAAVLEDLFKELRAQRECAFREGADAARAQIREALGL